MKIKKRSLIWHCLIMILVMCCTDHDISDKSRPDLQALLNERASLPSDLLDSTINAEALVKDVPEARSKKNGAEAGASSLTLVNYARQAAVSAESTYPGYSVARINDGSRTTTVGPSYSWANNFPAGGKLPESVFLRFSSLKTISRIDIYTSSGYAMQNYTILYRTTSSASWISLLSVTGNTAVSRSHTFTPVTVLEVQVMCQLGPAVQTIYGRLNEVEIYGDSEPYMPSTYVENGRLVFASETDLQQAVNYLEYKYEQYTRAFLSQNPGKTDDELNTIEENTGFDDNRPYIDFENAYGISSLRARVAYEEQQWLQNTSADENAPYPDPDETYYGFEEERTLLNYYGEVKVGSYVNVFNNDGSYYQYYDGGGCSPCALTAAKVRKLKKGDPLPEGVTLVKSEASSYISNAIISGPGNCERYIRSDGRHTNGSWRMKWKIKAHDGPFGACGELKAVTKSFKKRVFGIWAMKGARISAYAWGQVWDGSCSSSTNIETVQGTNVEWARKKKAKGFYCGKVKQYEIKGQHYHTNVGTFIEDLH
jgi:hypothetical protein